MSDSQATKLGTTAAASQSRCSVRRERTHTDSTLTPLSLISNFVIIVSASHAKCAPSPARQSFPDLRLIVLCGRVSAAILIANATSTSITIIIMMNNMLPVLVPVLLLAIVSAQITPQSHIRFQDNAYSGLTVSFSPDIPFHQRDTLITHSQVSNRIRVV